MSFLRKQESRVLIYRYSHINHPRMGYSALSVSTSIPFSISLSAFLFESQIPKIHGFHTKPDVNIVFPSETVHQIVFMLVDTINEVRGHACI